MKLYDTELEKPFILPNFIKLETFDLIIKVIIISSFFVRETEATVTRGSCCPIARELYLSGS